MLDACVPDLVDEIVIMQEKGIGQIVAERLVMKGFTHQQAGSWECEKLKLPEDIKEIIEFHHTPLMAKKYADEVNIMNIADAISSLYYEKLLGVNNKYILNKTIMGKLGITINDIEEISRILPEKVEEANKQFKFNLFIYKFTIFITRTLY